MQKIFFSTICFLATTCSMAQSIDAPQLAAGDIWVYRDTLERGAGGWNQTRDELKVTRATSTSIYYESKASGSSQMPSEKIMGID